MNNDYNCNSTDTIQQSLLSLLNKYTNPSLYTQVLARIHAADMDMTKQTKQLSFTDAVEVINDNQSSQFLSFIV